MRNSIKKAYGSKAYVLLLTLTALCGFGFKVIRPTIGIDDTPHAYYFEEGLAPVVGRWVLFVLNKFIHVSDFAPFVTEFAAVLLLMAAVTVWGALFYSCLEDRIPRVGYWMFSCIFLSCPLLAEVFTYYLHNGASLGYLFCGLSLTALRTAYRSWAAKDKRRALGQSVLSLVTMVAAMGCYESFMIVWLVGLLLFLFADELAGKGGRVFFKLVYGALVAAAAMVLRSVVIEIVIAVFSLQGIRDQAVLRSITEMFGWMVQPGAWGDLSMALKRTFVMYGAFGIVYYPIGIFVLTAMVFLSVALWRAVKQRDPWLLLLAIGSYIAAFLLVFVEGSATLYRSAQFVPLLSGFGMLMGAYTVSVLMEALAKKPKQKPVRRIVGGVSLVLAASILWNQCTDLNHWFYVDYNKYQYTRDYLSRVAIALERDFDTTKPVLFTGEWENPRGIVADAYVEIGSPDFYRLKRIVDPVDEHLLEKFYRPYGVWVAQTPSLSVVSWGKYAFETDEELIRFFAMHGHALRPLTDSSYYEDAEQFSMDLPSFPAEGSIVDMGDYIIVHF